MKSVILVVFLLLLPFAFADSEDFGVTANLMYEKGEFHIEDVSLGKGSIGIRFPNENTPVLIFKLFDADGNVIDEYDVWFPEEQTDHGPPTEWENTGRIEDHYRERGMMSLAFKYSADVSSMEAYLIHDKVTGGEEQLLASEDISHLSIEEYLICNGDYQCNNDETVESCPSDCVYAGTKRGENGMPVVPSEVTLDEPLPPKIEEESSYGWVVILVLIVIGVILYRKRKTLFK
ncbi:TPA: hypothetical protein HA278_02650 [Candidatus Woesearchaeota archaeon]|nr:hypothetical protein [archaeon]HIJ10934.1 hypothetical protein [Candidatus Woesearchaeota archaeon]